MVTRAETLRTMRLEKRLTQAEIADRLKVSQAYYSSIENGRRPTEIDEAIQTVNKMRLRGDRTEGGGQKAGRKKA